MQATVTYKAGDKVMTKVIKDVVKVEKTHTNYDGKLLEETRVYTHLWHWSAWRSDAIINIFLEA